MRKKVLQFLIFYLVISITLYGQNAAIETSINNGELKMSFPSIYFKHNSTDYAKMPYTVDSCFKYIADNIKYINSRPIWRDSSEAEQLTNERIKKLKADLIKYRVTKIKIQSMYSQQKIPQHTIYTGTDSSQIQYLLSLNSVLDISRTKTLTKPHNAWHLPCWMNLQLNKEGRKRCKIDKRNEKKNRRHLVWTGWKTGFHWSTP